MMAIFGWICLVVLMLTITSSWFIMWFNHGGRWTIGGDTNAVSTRIITSFIGVVICIAWYFVFSYCPFTLVLR
jgi:hypothetical protein